jgi:arsenate reductase-like glutaredoxin family protein
MIECDNQYKVKYYIKEYMKKEFEGDMITGNITIIKDQFLDLVNKYSEYKDNYHDYILDDKSDKDDDDDIIDEITTYEDYIKTSKISHIVITEPKLLIGYYLIERDNIWLHFDRINH